VFKVSNIKVFLCYHHNPKDEPLVEELKTRLKSLKRLGLINVVWHDQLVEPGLEPESEIDKHLSSAQIILLLISPDFIASDVYDRSVKPALLRQEREEARVIPIILRPTSWQEALSSNFKFCHQIVNLLLCGPIQMRLGWM
jgi:TIR domain